MSAAEKSGFCLSGCGRNINRLTNRKGQCGTCIAKREPTASICQSCGHLRGEHAREKSCERCSCKAYVAFDQAEAIAFAPKAAPTSAPVLVPVPVPAVAPPAAALPAGNAETVPAGLPGGHCPACGKRLRADNTRGIGPVHSANQSGKWKAGDPFKPEWITAIRAKRQRRSEEPKAATRWTCRHGCQYDETTEGGVDHCDNCAPCRIANIAAHQMKLAKETQAPALPPADPRAFECGPVIEATMTPPEVKATPERAAVPPSTEILLIQADSALQEIFGRITDAKVRRVTLDARASLHRIRLELDAQDAR